MRKDYMIAILAAIVALTVPVRLRAQTRGGFFAPADVKCAHCGAMKPSAAKAPS